ncbi:MAG: hypothetical protein SFV19_16840 [Rhodospirillaceae bacterium]|nr:hypothetical protein [Rhodospirillaceae bacterium]
MPLPEPEPGLVIRYDYLWSDQAATGQDHGKDRPACLVAASEPGASPRFVLILPITHTPPKGATVGIEIPRKVRLALGLDDAPSWVIVSEYNVDEWPNGGLSPLPGAPGSFSYGFIPPGLFARIKQTFLDLSAAGKGRPVRR